MRVIPRARRRLRGLLYALAAAVTIVGGTWLGAASREPFSWLLPILGLCAYGVFASQAMLLWQGRRTKPRPPRAVSRPDGHARRIGRSPLPRSGFRGVPQ